MVFEKSSREKAPEFFALTIDYSQPDQKPASMMPGIQNVVVLWLA